MSTDALPTIPYPRSTAASGSRRWLLPLLAVLFFATGISGLMYQVLWLRILALTFGVTVYAVATVLSSFMAGLGLGSFLAGRIADRIRNPLLVYGIAEIFVGAFGFSTVWGFRLLHNLYVVTAPAIPGDSLLAVSLLRAAFAFGVLIIPTSLMGATLPIIIKSSFLRTEGLSSNISLLYAVNTLGAMVGAFVAGFFLIGTIGIQASIAIAAIINVSAGLLAVLLSRVTVSKVRQETAATAPVTSEDGYNRRILLTVLVAFSASGFCSLAYEVVWVRILSLLFAATTYAFTLMLTTVLLAIALGSWAVNLVINRKGNWLLTFAAIEILVGLWGLGSIEVLSHVYGITNRIAALGPLSALVAGDNRFIIFVSFVVMFPPMFLLGMTFPIAAKLFISNDPAVGARIGTIYAGNVVGAIFGSFVAGFVLIPFIGTQNSLLFLAAVNLALGVLLLSVNPRLRIELKLVGAAGAVAAVVAMAVLGSPLQQRLVEGRFPGRTVWHKEGLETTVSVVEEQGALVLYLNGQHQANNTSNMVTLHRLIGHLPVLLHPDPKRSLSIGLGGGATPGAISQHPGMDVTIVELSESVVEGAEFFKDVNYDLMQLPNVHLRLDDGRNFLLLSGEKFDIMTADVVKPRNAGSGALYSANYFRLAREALTEQGLMLIWLDPSLPDYQYKLMMRTFADAFPYTTLWDGGQLIVGSKSPIMIDPDRIQRSLNHPESRRALAEDNIRSVKDVTDKFVAGDAEIRQFTGPGATITDDKPLIEYFRLLPTGGEPDRSRFSRDPSQIIKR